MSQVIQSRIRNIFIAVGVALFICLVLLVATGRVLEQRFQLIEHDQALSMGRQVERAMDADMHQLEISTRTLAQSDQAFNYVLHPSRDFENSNFKYVVLKLMHVDVVWVLDAAGKELFSAQSDATNEHLNLPADPQWLRALAPYRARVAEIATRDANERLVAVPDGILAFSMVPISKSDGTGTTGAVLFFGRLLDIDELQRISEASHYSVDMLILNGDNPRELAAPAARDWLRQSTPDEAVYASQDGAPARVFVMLRDIEGRPSAILTFAKELNVSALGRQTTWSMLGALGLLIMLSAAVAARLFLRLQRSLLKNNYLYQQHHNIVQSLDESVLLVAADTLKIRQANPALLRRIGYEEHELKQLSLHDVCSGLSMAVVEQSEHCSTTIHECQLVARSGERIDIDVTLTKVSDVTGPLLCVLGRDVTARKQAERAALEHRRKLTKLATHDALTGLPNRLFLHQRLPRILRRLAEGRHLLAVYYVDMDNFKNINDSRGHPFGDKLLKIFAGRLRASVNSHDVVVRMGGDEFVIVAPLLLREIDAEAIAQRLVVSAQAPILIEDVSLSVTASIGVALYPRDAMDADTLLKHADIALYQAKEAGRNTYRIFTADMNIELSEQLALEQALRHAIGNDELYVEYQPVVELATGRMASMEALLRWRHPEIGQVPPGRFIPVAEKSGLMLLLGEYVLRKVIEQLKSWQAQGVPLVPVAVNISPVQLQRDNLPKLIDKLLVEGNVDAEYLHFEITESALLNHSQEMIVMLETLRTLGSRISIDDFGTGFSNLSYLKHLPVDTVKIDKSFVADVATDSSDAAIVGSIISMSTQLELRTVAEGIETQAQLDKLRAMGCSYGQGYHFARPMSAANCESILRQMGTMRTVREYLQKMITAGQSRSVS